MRRQVGQEVLAKGHLRQSHFQRRHFGREFPAYSCQAGQGLRRLHASVRVRCRRQRSARHWQKPSASAGGRRTVSRQDARLELIANSVLQHRQAEGFCALQQAGSGS